MNNIELTEETIDGYLSYANIYGGFAMSESEIRALCKAARHGVACKDIDPDENDRTINQLIRERDDAEDAMSKAYAAVTDRSAEWSALFGYAHAVEEMEDHCRAAIDPAAHRRAVDALEKMVEGYCERTGKDDKPIPKSKQTPEIRAAMEALAANGKEAV